MLFLQSHSAKTKFDLNEDTALSHYALKKCKNKERKAIRHKISQILGLQLIRSSKVVEEDKTGKYQLLSEKKNAEFCDPCPKDILHSSASNGTLDNSRLNQINDVPQPQLCSTITSEISSPSSSLTSTTSPVPRQRKLTPPPPPVQLFSEFPSTRSNRKGKNNPGVEQGGRRQRRKSCNLEQPEIQVPKETCVNVMIGRMVCRKYIPRLQRIEELSSGLN